MEFNFFYAISEDRFKLYTLKYQSTEYGNGSIICFAISICFPAMLVIFLSIRSFSIFKNAERTMCLNNLLYVKLPQSMRRFRDVPMKSTFEDQMTDGAKGSAYFRNWRLSQEKINLEKMIEVPQSEEEEAEREEKEQVELVELKDNNEIDNSNAYFAKTLKHNAQVIHTRPYWENSSDVSYASMKH